MGALLAAGASKTLLHSAWSQIVTTASPHASVICRWGKSKALAGKVTHISSWLQAACIQIWMYCCTTQTTCTTQATTWHSNKACI